MVTMNGIRQMLMIGVHGTGRVNGNDRNAWYRES